MDKSIIIKLKRLLENFTIKKWSKTLFLSLKKKEMSHVFIIEIYMSQQLQLCSVLEKLKEKEKNFFGKIGILNIFKINLIRMKAAKAKDV